MMWHGALWRIGNILKTTMDKQHMKTLIPDFAATKYDENLR